MKKALSIIISILMVLSIFTAVPFTVGAVTSGDYEYNILDDGTAKITDYTGEATKLAIPSTLDGYTVTGIEYRAFAGCENITNLTIPYTVTNIGYGAFSSCTGLSEITIPDSVNIIAGYAFGDCTNLKTVTIGKGITSIGPHAFMNCSSLTTVNYNAADCVDMKGYSTFSNVFTDCSNLTTVNIGDSVKVIPNKAFDGCTGLKNVTIPNSVEKIGFRAFAYCTSLTEIKIPDTVKNIDYGAFIGCTSLTDIEVSEKSSAYSSLNGNLYNKSQTELIQYAVGKTETPLIIPNSVTSIGDYAFCGYKTLNIVTVPDSVTSIGKEAFAFCENLKTITLPDSITSMGSYAFIGTAWYENQPEGLVYAGKVAYEYKGACPQTVVLKEDTTAIADYAFSDCENLTEITIPNTVKSIGNYAFLYCNSLIEITIPDSVANIGDYAFGYYYNYDSEAYEKAENLNITGYSGTEAEKYAKENDIEFISLGDKSVLLGDVNGDGKITITDATTVQKHLAKLTELSDEQLTNADTNNDGKITITDATRIQKYLAKLIPSLG